MQKIHKNLLLFSLILQPGKFVDLLTEFNQTLRRKPQQYPKKKPPNFSFLKFHKDNLILAAVELKKTTRTTTTKKTRKNKMKIVKHLCPGNASEVIF